ncbi:DUF4345 domain-containing protein [Caulobacter flavus]|jgi:hypothetical protein|uniref:DUF4345 domain-containing protein n=1 Tax=Caulobacter flavus TaxID=1679497 RepID=A0A2N5CNA0_9CAUL|nr:DUF4345 family protein [Caulobacter flavus]AYV46684.1 DUF4345 domain-containing protein [Caulobacter flavus]PLR07920.1 DUF4345 domain-containing protein [Caulobacter flavus]
MSSYALSLVLAVIACVIGGVLGGLVLARPDSMLGLAGLKSEQDGGVNAVTEGRAFGGLLIASHGAAALFLGWQSSAGAAMALVLAIAWFGAAFGRLVSMLLQKAGGRFNYGSVLLDILMGITLALPFFNEGSLPLHRIGGSMLV